MSYDTSYDEKHMRRLLVITEIKSTESTESTEYRREGRGMEKEVIGIKMRDAQHTVGSLTWVSRGKGRRLKSVYPT